MILLPIRANVDLLGDFALEAARQARPHASAVRAVLAALAGRSEPHDLAQVALAFLVDSSESLPHDGAEVVVTVLEVLVVLPVLAVVGVLLARVLRVDVRVVERARHGDVQRESSLPTPLRDRHVSRAAWPVP